MLRLPSFLLALAATLHPTTTATAQCASIPGTGCPGTLPLVCSGPPQLNQVAQITYVAPGPLDIVVSSINLDGTLIGLPVGFACGPGCVLAGFPAAWAVGFGAAQFLFFVPNNAGLIGLPIFGQALYAPANLGYTCWLASNALVGNVIP